MPRKRGPGRPPRNEEAAGKITVRVTDSERAAWEAVASPLPLGVWIRDVCNKATQT